MPKRSLDNHLQRALEETEIRRLTMSASRIKDPDKARQAAFKAWKTIRKQRMKKAGAGTVTLQKYQEHDIRLTLEVAFATYKLIPPLIKRSKLTIADKGGVGKQLSDGWALNYAIGCTFGCRFCYVDEIHKNGGSRGLEALFTKIGDTISPSLITESAIKQTNWKNWKGQEIMLSSTHDPYLPQLYKWTRKILENALPEGVRFCIQTRSPLVEQDFDLLKSFSSQVRLQVSVSTMNKELSRVIEPRVVPPERRLEILRRGKAYGLRTGVIVAPVFPATKLRIDFEEDLELISWELSRIRPDNIYGESIHVRGINMAYLESALGEQLRLEGFDAKAAKVFHESLQRYGLKGIWWPEY